MLSRVYEIAKASSLKSGCHGWEHTERVRRLALRIGREEKADLEVLEIAALLHDIGRKNERECHAKEGAEKARKILDELGYDKTAEVVYCIKTHRFSGNTQPETLEAKIIQDADKLDAIGAVGIARCFMYRAEIGEGIKNAENHFHEKLLRLKDLMHTQTSRKIAVERHEFLEEFLERLKKEEKGEL